MKTKFLFLLLCLPSLLSAQTTQTFSNPALVQITNAGPGSIYPSTISVTGMPAYLHEFVVRFDIVTTNSLAEADLLLEAPNGQQLVLMSDLPLNGVLWFTNLGIGTIGQDTLRQDNIADNRDFQPANYGEDEDNFPTPGPGAISQPLYPNPFALQDINPNGEWKLYLVDDENNFSDMRLLNGWNLTITAANVPACKRPGIPEIIEIQDRDVTLSWTPGAGNITWDAYITMDLNFQPVTTTIPTHNDLTQNQNIVLDSLEPGQFHALFVRADCGDEGVSPWIGPVFFQTSIHPCEEAIPISLCTPVDYPTLPHYLEYYFDSGYTWSFSFTAPEAGDYWMQFEGNSGFAPVYRPDIDCDAPGWIQMEAAFETGLTYKMSNLVGGQTYWILHHNNPSVEHQEFHITPCPLREMEVDAVIPSTDSLEVYWVNFPFLTDTLEFYYGPVPLTTPDDNTAALLTGVVLVPNQPVTFKNLIPDTDYHIYVRRRCDNGDVSCWQGPFLGTTAPVCSQIDFLSVDTVTYSWAEISFTWQSFQEGVNNWQLRVCLPGSDPSTQFVKEFNISTIGIQDTLTVLLNNIPSYLPLQLYIKAFCNGGIGGQPWQGPFDIPAGMAPPVPVSDIFCDEVNSTFPSPNWFDSFLYSSNGCYPFFVSLGEKLFRFQATQTGQARIVWASGWGGNSGSGTGFFVKPASIVPGNQDWEYLGCYRYEFGSNASNYPEMVFDVQKDSTYYLLCDGFDGIAAHTPGSFDFRITNCGGSCPPVDSIILASSTANSVTLVWNQPEPGSTYSLEYKPAFSGNDPVVLQNLSDTSITLEGLYPAILYEFWLRTFCPDGSASQKQHAEYYVGEHPVYQESVVNRCTPHVHSPTTGIRNVFDMVSLEVTQDGLYFIAANFPELYIYTDNFDPENPSANLLASVLEGSIPQYSIRKDTVLMLESGAPYFLVATGYSADDAFSSSGYGVGFWADGPGTVVLGEPVFNRKEDRPHGMVPTFSDWGVRTQFYACADTSGWRNFYAIDGNHIDDPEYDLLLLSIEDYPLSDGLDDNELELYGGPGASLITNPPALYPVNPSGWYAMNRFWNFPDVEPWYAPDQPIKVRAYYTQQEFEDLKSAIELAGGSLPSHEDMYFYKINGIHDPNILAPVNGHPNVPAATSFDAPYGFWEYSNGPEATASTWKHGMLDDAHYAEMLISSFSGGGGGATVNGNSVFDPITGNWNLGLDTNILLFPNPTNGLLTLRFDGAILKLSHLQIVDLYGRVVLKEVIAPGLQEYSLSMEVLPAGIYLIKVMDEGVPVWVEKLVKH